MTGWEKGMALFAATYSCAPERELSIKEAKDYIQHHGYTHDDVRISDVGTMIVVVQK